MCKKFKKRVWNDQQCCPKHLSTVLKFSSSSKSKFKSGHDSWEKDWRDASRDAVFHSMWKYLRCARIWTNFASCNTKTLLHFITNISNFWNFYLFFQLQLTTKSIQNRNRNFFCTNKIWLWKWRTNNDRRWGTKKVPYSVL